MLEVAGPQDDDEDDEDAWEAPPVERKTVRIETKDAKHSQAGIDTSLRKLKKSTRAGNQPRSVAPLF